MFRKTLKDRLGHCFFHFPGDQIYNLRAIMHVTFISFHVCEVPGPPSYAEDDPFPDSLSSFSTSSHADLVFSIFVSSTSEQRDGLFVERIMRSKCGISYTYSVVLHAHEEMWIPLIR